MPNDIHIHIPQGFAGVMTIGGDGNVTVTSAAPPASSAASIWPTLDAETAEQVEELLSRHRKHNPSTRSRDVIELLVKRGWAIFPNSKATYIRCEYAGTKHPVTLYCSSKDLNNAKMSQRDFMASLPDVDVHKPDVRIQINGTHFEQASKNIEAVEKWADS